MLASLAVLGSSATCFCKTINLSASFWFHPLFFTRSLSHSAIWLVFIFDGIVSGFFAAVSPTSCFLDFPDDSPVSTAAAALDEDAADFGAGVLDLNRWAGPAKGSIGGGLLSLPMRLLAGPVPMLRPLVGLGATMTSTGGVIGFDFDLSLFVGLLSAGGTVVVSAAALDELDAAPGVREALLLLALAFSALGTEAARGGVSFSGVGSGSIFDRAPAFASSAACFPLRRVASLIKFGSGFLNLSVLILLILPLPGGGGGPPPGGGAIPAGVSGGPGCMCNINSLAFRSLSAALPTTFVPYGDFRTASIFTAFPLVAFSPLTLAIIGDPPGPGGPGGWFQPGAYTGSVGVLFGCGIACFTILSTYDWSIDAAPDGPM
jgi:hypothetical protein